MKLPTWMHRKGGGKRQRRKKAQENEQASGILSCVDLLRRPARDNIDVGKVAAAVAADGTVAAPPQAQIQQRPSLQRPTSEHRALLLVSARNGCVPD